jgi:asparagine synthetase B (glutamine-hydrolysing)
MLCRTGYNWIDSLRDNAEARVSDRQFEQRAHRFPFNTPPTKEAYFVREVFEAHFPSVAAIQTVKGGPSIACSTAAAIEWDETFKAAAHVGESDHRQLANYRPRLLSAQPAPPRLGGGGPALRLG